MQRVKLNKTARTCGKKAIMPNKILSLLYTSAGNSPKNIKFIESKCQQLPNLLIQQYAGSIFWIISFNLMWLPLEGGHETNQ